MEQKRHFWWLYLRALAGMLLLLLPLVVLLWMTGGETATIDTLVMFVALSTAICAIGVYGGLWWVYQRYIGPAFALAEQAQLASARSIDQPFDAPPHPPLGALGARLNSLLSQYTSRVADVEDRIAAARAETARERGILSALLAELSDGVLVCTLDGQILLYNERARRLLRSSEQDDTSADTGLIGLGRSVFNVIDRNVLTHALDDLTHRHAEGLEAHPTRHFVTAVKGQRFVRIRLALILDDEATQRGFVVVANDVTPEVQSRTARQRLQTLLEAKPDQEVADPTALSFFRDRLDRLLHQWGAPGTLSDDKDREEEDTEDLTQWSLDAMLGADLLDAIVRRAQQKLGITVDVEGITGEVWVHVDSYAAVHAVLFLMQHVNKRTTGDSVRCEVQSTDQVVALTLRWDGPALSDTVIDTWRRVPVLPDDTEKQLSLDDVLNRHQATLKPFADDDGHPGLTLELPAAVFEGTQQRPLSRPRVGGRPIYYDFDLLDTPGDASPGTDEPLTRVTYTVFDTETTGLEPDAGDKIISLGAVRILNQRVLQGETFDALIDPERPLALDSVRIHGIQPSTLRGKPTITTVLPRFHQFAGDTVLVGHNVAFDLSFIRRQEPKLDIHFTQSVLDTLLLADIVNPNRSDYSLDVLAADFGIPVTGRHTALGDAMITAELLLKLIPLLKQQGINTLNDVLTASRSSRFANLSY